jgi:hypothetical protein
MCVPAEQTPVKQRCQANAVTYRRPRSQIPSIGVLALSFHLISTPSIRFNNPRVVRMIPVPSVGYFYYHLAKGGASVPSALAAVVGKDRSEKDSLLLGPGGTASCLAATARSGGASNKEILVTLSLSSVQFAAILTCQTTKLRLNELFPFLKETRILGSDGSRLFLKRFCRSRPYWR